MSSRQVLLLGLVCVRLLMFPGDAAAHAPHDEISAILLSPFYLYDGIVFAIVRFNLLRSTDRGCRWHRLTRGFRKETFTDLAISPAFAADRCVFAASEQGAVFRSRDAGESWVSVSRGLPGRPIMFLDDLPDVRG